MASQEARLGVCPLGTDFSDCKKKTVLKGRGEMYSREKKRKHREKGRGGEGPTLLHKTGVSQPFNTEKGRGKKRGRKTPPS